ncbi:MAG: hypothetical protein JW984_00845 [Deltaproteobacteria bacterium]|uniref:Peptidase C45 hydrolase domain-containing protein n=1 Tax=Candidatus Zymogenus saltonus TaxID=2844893 RepID=A0A9D8PIR2_9DELT|nr:hypothetical protein [Candidatus Zymogenus saltonus]
MITISLEGNIETRGFEEGRYIKDILEKIIWGDALKQIDNMDGRALSKKMGRAYGESLKMELKRINALSRGAVIEPEELFKIYLTELGEVFRYAPPTTALLMGLSYKNFEEGFPALCVNLDAPFYLHPFMTFKKIYADDEFSRLEVSLITSPGAIFGINDGGLSVALGLKPFEGNGKGFLPLSGTISEILRKCKSVDTAKELIGKIPRGASGMMAIADPNEIAVVELTPDSFSVRGEREGFIVSTQHFLSERLMSVDLPHLEVHPETSPPELFERRIYDLSERRFEETCDVIKSKIRWNVSGITDAISSGKDLLYLTEGYYKTSISAAMIPGRRCIYLKESRREPFIRHIL